MLWNSCLTVSSRIVALYSTPLSTSHLQGTLVGNTNNVTSVMELLAADPSSANPLIGYQIIKGPLTAAQLVPEQSINTTDTLKQFGAPDRTLAVTIPAPNTVSLTRSSFAPIPSSDYLKEQAFCAWSVSYVCMRQ